MTNNKPVPLNLADAFLPDFDWDNEHKRNYLSFRLCGFSRTEACDLVGIKLRTMYHWRDKDPGFDEIERKNLGEISRSFSKHAVLLEFLRNTRLALHIDTQHFMKAITDPTSMTADEKDYLKRIRPLYTARELQAAEALIMAGAGEEQSFDEIIVSYRRRVTHETPPPQVDHPISRSPTEYIEGSVNEERSEVRTEEEEAS